MKDIPAKSKQQTSIYACLNNNIEIDFEIIFLNL